MDTPHGTRSKLSKFTIVVGLATGILIAALFGLYVREQLEEAKSRPPASPAPTVTIPVSDGSANQFSGGTSGGGGSTGTRTQPGQINRSAGGSGGQINQPTTQNPQNPGLTDPTTRTVCDATGVCVSL